MSEIRPSTAAIGLNLNSSLSQVKEGELTFALNATVEGFDGHSISYQNEGANIDCVSFPIGYEVVGQRNILERGYTVFMLSSPSLGSSEIGKVNNNTCEYQTIANASCFNFSVNKPIHKIYHKATNCSTEIYWTDGGPMRWMDLDNLPYIETEVVGECDNVIHPEIDCNKLLIQPNFSIPRITYIEEGSEGNIQAGTVQFAVQYANVLGDPLTSFFSITNPFSIGDNRRLTQDFNFSTGKSVIFEVDDIDTTGVYEYLNLIVIKTVNSISTPELIETKKIVDSSLKYTYTGASQTNIKLSMDDIFEKFPIFDKVEGLFEVQDVLGWHGLTLSERISYQKIANQIHLQWETWKINDDGYTKGKNTAEVKGHMRDEVYAPEFVPVLKRGRQADRFHIPGRKATPYDLQIISNEDGISEEKCDTPIQLPRWKRYNTASLIERKLICDENKQPQSKKIVGTISTICSDNNCSEQGNVGLSFTFESPTPTPIYLQISEVHLLNSIPLFGPLHGTKVGTGWDIHPLPDGVAQDTYYDNNAAPFAVTIPAGTTSLTIPELIFKEGGSGPAWYCQPCIWPITDLILKSTTADNYVVTFSSPQGYTINNLPTPPPKEEAIEEECIDDCYEGTYEYGEFGYYESTDLYPCDVDVWGDLANQPIRHHRFPDSSITHIHDDKGNIFPIGFRVDVDQIKDLIRNSDLTKEQKEDIIGFKIVRGNRANSKSVIAKGLLYNVGVYEKDKQKYFYPNYPFNDLRADPFINTIRTGALTGPNTSTSLEGFKTEDSHKRFTFHSPDTHFYQPSVGENLLKLETVEYGESRGHMVEVKEHARYRFLAPGSYSTALIASIIVGVASNEIGLTIKVFDGTAAIAAFAALISIIEKLTPRKSFAYQFNSLADYNKYIPIPNDFGNKVRVVDLISYIVPGMTSAGDIFPINNFQRESSVFIRTTKPLPFPHEVGAPEDRSRWVLNSEGSCNDPEDILTRPVSSYYASIKKDLVNQYGPIYSYQSVDTGFYQPINVYENFTRGTRTVFGGDTFINRFALKRKLPFFIDNRVKFADDADVAYDEIGNVGYPTWWYSTDSRADDGSGAVDRLKGFARIFGVKRNNFDCERQKYFYRDGKIYLFAYGIPYFYCESEVNVDFRQAFNDEEGDFFPHVGGDIPDYWLQEIKTSIQFDNTFHYNKTYSKQNAENYFTFLPLDFKPECERVFPNTAIYSDRQSDIINYKRNNWLTYRTLSKFDFPLNYGKLVSVEGIENRAVLARFESKSMIYNALLTVDTSTPLAAYLGNDKMFKSAPPIDFAETDYGYAGTQNKFYLKTRYGGVSVDAQRGQIFLIAGNQAVDITSDEHAVGSFFKDNLPFKIKEFFPDINTDNHFKGVGITGVFDTRFNRLIITKLDYIPLPDSNLLYEGDEFWDGETKVMIGDPNYFCNKSFTLSFDFENSRWISFHSYTPKYYVGDVNRFYSGISGSLWGHHTQVQEYNKFYGEVQPYIIEYPFSYKKDDEILQSVSDYTKAQKQLDKMSSITTGDYFNKALIYNSEQCCSLNLVPKPKNNIKAYLGYPKYNGNGVEVLVTKNASFYNYNFIFDMVKDNQQPIFTEDCSPIDKAINPFNIELTQRSYRNFPIRAKDCRIRHILDNSSSFRLISQFIITKTQISYK